MELKDKVALITGASRGIGLAIAIELAKRGASVDCTPVLSMALLTCLSRSSSHGQPPRQLRIAQR